MRHLSLPLALALAGPAWAADEAPLSAEAFAQAVTGKTLYFTRRGAPYGAEQYLPGREVIWTFLDGHCVRGRWYEAREHICFVYENEPEPQCWDFLETERGLAARGEGADPVNDLVVAGESRAPLDCDGPVPGA